MSSDEEFSPYFDSDLTRRAFVSQLARAAVLTGSLGVADLLAPSTSEAAPSIFSAASAVDTIKIGVGNIGTQTPDPHLAQNTLQNQPITFAVGDPLVRREMDGKLTPTLATGWSISNDGRTWTFTLRRGVKMHDGSTFTARDMKTALDRVKNVPGFLYFDPLTKAITNVRVVNDYTIAITTAAKFANMYDQLPVPIATGYYNSIGEAGFRARPIAAGPFRFTSQQLNSNMSFTRFDRFWDKKRLPNFRTLTVLLLPDESSRVAGMQSGSLDVAHGLGAESIQQLRGVNNVRILNNPQSVSVVLFYADLYHPRTPSPLLNIRVRRALSYALDRAAMARTIYRGLAVSSDNVYLPITPGYVKGIKPQYTYNPTLARQLLAGQGDVTFQFRWRIADGGIPSVDLVGPAMASYWRDVGVNVQAIPTQAATLTSLQLSHQLTGTRLVGTPGANLIDPAYLAQTNFLSDGLASNVLDPKVDYIVKSLQKTIEPGARRRVAEALTKYVHSNVIATPIFNLTTSIAIGRNVKQFPIPKNNSQYGPWWYARTV